MVAKAAVPPARVRLGHEDAIGVPQCAQGLEREVLGVAGTDAHADEHAGAHAIAPASRRRIPAPAAATRRAATAGVAAQWVCR